MFYFYVQSLMVLSGFFFRMETSSTYEYFLALPTGSLKDYLMSLRGLSITGKKVELVAEAHSAQELKIPIKLPAEQQVNINDKDRISESPVQSLLT